MGRKRKYNEAYKREAVTTAKASGNVSQTAGELGIIRHGVPPLITQRIH
jgi:transposase-like protein